MQFFTILGPTASGKTDLSINLAKYAREKYSTEVEIISLDSALVYKYMDIGTAKPDKEQQQGIKHHLIDIINPTQNYNVGTFLQDVFNIVKNKQKALPIIVGGTMLYYNALVKGLHNIPSQNQNIRQQIINEAQIYGWEYMYKKLLNIDAKANYIQANDTQRIQRALEIYCITNQPPSYFYEQIRSSPYTFHTIALNPNREILHINIKNRFNTMLEKGFLKEVEKILKQYPSLNENFSSIRCVGYRQAYQYLNNQIDYNEFVDRGIIATRQLAKRQITWLRKLDVINIDVEDNLKFEKVKQEFDIYYAKNLL